MLICPSKPVTVKFAKSCKANTEKAIAEHLDRFTADTGFEVIGILVKRNTASRMGVSVVAKL